MALKFQHTFPEVAGTDLAATTPEVGGPCFDTAIDKVETDGIGGLKFLSINQGSRWDVGSADQWVVANWNSGGADNRCSLLLRADDSASTQNGYVFNFRPGDAGGAIEISSIVGGSQVSIDSKTGMGLDISTTYSLEPRVVGTTLVFAINGVDELTVINNTAVTTGNFNKVLHNLWTNGNARFYDIEVYDSDPKGVLKVSDTMAGANGDDLDSRAPEVDIVGAGWQLFAANDVEVDGVGGARFATINKSARLDIGATDQRGIINWNSGGAVNNISLYLRSDDSPDTGTAYYFTLKPGDGTGSVSIVKTVAGSPSAVASKTSMGLSTSTTYELDVSAVDDGSGGVDLELKLDGVSELTYKDTTSIITTGNFVKIRHGSYANNQGRIYDINAYEATAAVSSSSAVITGTLDLSLQSDIVTGGKTTIITLSGDTFLAAGTGAIGTTSQTQSIIDGCSAAQIETLGWNNEVTGTLVRTSDTVATITWAAASNYVITRPEIIDIVIPNEVLITSAIDVTGSSTQFISDNGSTAPFYYFRDTETGADANATSGSDANDGLSDANAFETYGKALTLNDTTEAGTRMGFARSCAFSQATGYALDPANSVITISSITRSVSTATATTTKPHNLLVGAITTISGCDQTEYNIEATILSVTSTTFTYTVSGTPVTATTSFVIRFTGGEITFQEYVSDEFTPITDAKPYCTYTDSTLPQHAFQESTSCEGMIFKDLSYKYTGTAVEATHYCFWFYDASKDTFTWDDVIIDGYRVAVRPDSGLASHKNFTIKNSIIKNNWAHGVLGGTIEMLIENNNVFNNGHFSFSTGGEASLHNLYLGGDYLTVRGNTLYQSALNLSGVASGVSLVIHGNHTDYIIEDNYIYEDIGFSGNGAWGIGIDTGYTAIVESFTNVIIRRNKIVNVGNVFIHANAWIDGIVENNVLIQNQSIGTRGIVFEDETTGTGNADNSNNTIRNNSMFGKFSIGIEASEGTGFNIVSNVLHSDNAGTVNMLDCPLSIINTTNYDVIDNNQFYAPSAATINYDNSVVGDLSAWQTASIFDDNSQEGDPLFTSSTNLIPLVGSPLIDNGHLTLSAIEDYLEVTRDATPDIGAYEYTGADTTAPILTLPTGTATSATTANGTVTTDEGNGALYYLATINATESAATIKAGSNQGVTVPGIQNVNFISLLPSTIYYPHYVQDDDATNESNVQSGASFTTPAAGNGGVSAAMRWWASL